MDWLEECSSVVDFSIQCHRAGHSGGYYTTTGTKGGVGIGSEYYIVIGTVTSVRENVGGGLIFLAALLASRESRRSSNKE
eukprot:4963771-Ditylum_brightwellii.AAC.1